jgi:hypothetical protein
MPWPRFRVRRRTVALPLVGLAAAAMLVFSLRAGTTDSPPAGRALARPIAPAAASRPPGRTAGQTGARRHPARMPGRRVPGRAKTTLLFRRHADQAAELPEPNRPTDANAP